MKKVALLSLLLILLQGNSPLPDSEELRQEYLKNRRSQYENGTIACSKYAHRFGGEYSYKSLYDYCCVNPTVDLDHRPESYKKPEITQAINAVLGIEKKCGKAWNECLRKELNSSPGVHYRCTKLSSGEALEWSDDDL